jgi:isoaspartyl peptidase/L-asparaginase-like protein (Ntn-hydrolase superfamily)
MDMDTMLREFSAHRLDDDPVPDDLRRPLPLRDELAVRTGIELSDRRKDWLPSSGVADRRRLRGLALALRKMWPAGGADPNRRRGTAGAVAADGGGGAEGSGGLAWSGGVGAGSIPGAGDLAR